MSTKSMHQKDATLLFVDDDVDVAEGLASALSSHFRAIHCADTLKTARVLAEVLRPDVVLLDVGLPDGSGLELAKELSLRHPVPLMVVMTGGATRVESFQASRFGVAALIEKPFAPTDFVEVLAEAASTYPSLQMVAAMNVGRTPLYDARQVVRQAMLGEALAKAEGNRTRAAKLLGVTRQTVDQYVKERESEATVAV